MPDDPPAPVEETESARGARAALWVQVIDSLPQMLVIVTLAGTLIGGLAFLTGGFRPSSLVEIENGKKDLAEIRLLITRCDGKLDAIAQAMPRSSDIAGWEAHFSRLDARFDELRDRLSKTEAMSQDTHDRVGTLTTVIPRGAR